MQSEAALCCRALGAEQDGFVTYGKFRNFLILLPEAKLREADPSIAWYEAATMVPFGEHRSGCVSGSHADHIVASSRRSAITFAVCEALQ